MTAVSLSSIINKVSGERVMQTVLELVDVGLDTSEYTPVGVGPVPVLPYPTNSTPSSGYSFRSV